MTNSLAPETRGFTSNRNTQIVIAILELLIETQMAELRVTAEHLPFFLKKLENQGFTGEVHFFTDTQNSKIYFAQGRVIWAFSTGQPESFQSILLKEFQYSASDISECIKNARADNKKSISHAIELLGIKDQDVIRTIVARHTKSALLTLWSWRDIKASLKVMRAADYTFLFSVDELVSSLSKISSATTSQNTAQNTIPDAIEQGDPIHASPPHPTVLDCSLLKQVAEETPGLVSLSVVECDTGMPIYYYPTDFGVDVELASAYFRNIFSQSSDTWNKFMNDAAGSAPLLAIELHTGNGQIILNHLSEVGFLICLILTNEADRDNVVQEIFSAVAKLRLL